MATSSAAQQRSSQQQVAQALDWLPPTSVLGPLPAPGDYHHRQAGIAGEAGEASDASAATVACGRFQGSEPVVLASRSIRLRLPRQQQQQQQQGTGSDAPVSGAGAAAAAGSEGASHQGTDSGDSSGAQAGKKRQREQAMSGVCSSIEAQLQGAVKVWLLLNSSCSNSCGEAGPVQPAAAAEESYATLCIQCVSKQLPEDGEDPAAAAAAATAAAKCDAMPAWKRLRVLVRQDDQQQQQREPPVAVFNPMQLPPGPPPQAAGGGDATLVTAAGSPQEQQQQQLLLAERAWSELQVLLQEAPAADVVGMAQQWCQAVEAVEMQLE
jgi:hypothetical protein